jgi:hypothetical protein
MKGDVMNSNQSTTAWIAASLVAICLFAAVGSRALETARTRFFVVVNTMFAATHTAPPLASSVAGCDR